MSFAKLHKWVSYLFAALGLFVLSLGPYLDLVSEVVILVAFVASWFVEGERIRDERWIRGWTIALFVFLGVQVLRGIAGASILPLGLEFTAALLISRLFNRRGAREHQQIGALTLLQLIAATVLSTEITYGLLFAGFVIVTPWMLALGHLRAEIEAQHPGEKEGEHDEEAMARVLASERLIGPRYLAGTAMLSVPLFLMTGVLFVVFPRVGLGIFSFGRSLGQQVSGFGANVELGNFGSIRSDPTVVLRVTPPDMPEMPELFRSLRMRGTSFDHYDGRRWTRSRDFPSEEVGRHGRGDYWIPERMPSPQDDVWQVDLDALDEPVIFLPPNTVAIGIPPRINGGIEVGRQVSWTRSSLDVRYEDADGLGLNYMAFTSDAPRRMGPLLEEPEIGYYLQVPEGHERVAALASEWAEGAEGTREVIDALLAHLTRSGELTYSLDMPDVGDDEQPLDVFLFEARRGHCEYFSTAMAVMLRSQGIPARNATGFLGGRYNEYGGYYAISQGDAHSWVEAWIDAGPEGAGRWVVIEATPPSRDAIRPDPGWFGTLQEMLDALKSRWADDVVSYDLRSQVQLFWQLRRWMRGEGDPPDEQEAPTGTNEAGASSRLVPWKLIVFGAGLLLFGFVLLRWFRRREEGQTVADPNARRAVELFEALEKVLTKLGWERPPDRTAKEHADLLEREGFAEARLVRQIVDRYLAVRYGGAPLGPQELDRLRRELKALRGRADLFAAAG